jgi:RNA polymerase sigma-70 factor, ECF subfamily
MSRDSDGGHGSVLASYGPALRTAAAPVARPLDPALLGDHVDRLYRAAWALCGSREDAEDLVQETYARVLARPRFLRGGDELAYLLGALRRTFVLMRRTESRRPRAVELPEHVEFVETRTSGDPESAFEAGRVYAAISSLEPQFRNVLVAVDVVGLSYEEAARSLDVPVGTVMSRLYRARQRVVRALGA